MAGRFKHVDQRTVWNAKAAAYQAHHVIPTDRIHYGPNVPTEDDLGLVGDPRGKDALEVGCGGGQNAIAFKKRGAARVAGIDLSDKQIAYARALATREGVEVEFHQGTVEDLGRLADASFDIAFSAFCFQYVRDLDRTMREVYRVLRPGGRFAFSMDHPIVGMTGEDGVTFESSYFQGDAEWTWALPGTTAFASPPPIEPSSRSSTRCAPPASSWNASWSRATARPRAAAGRSRCTSRRSSRALSSSRHGSRRIAMTETYTWEQRHERGLEAINTLIAGRVGPGARRAEQHQPQLARWASSPTTSSPATSWWRPGLSRRDRSLIVLAMLAANARHRETRFHVQAGINHGLTREEIEEIILHVALYAGWPVASESMGEITEVFREIDGVDRYPKRTPAERKDDAQRRHDGAAVAHSILGGRSPLDGEQALAMTSEQLGPVGQLALEFAFGEVWARPQTLETRPQPGDGGGPRRHRGVERTEGAHSRRA